MFTLRPYQDQGRELIKQAYAAGYKAALYTLPTGGGKTAVFTDICVRVQRKGNRVIVLVHRKELLDQASRKLDSLGVPHGIISPGHSMTGDLVQLASVQTIAKRLDRVQYPALIIIDECHHTTSASYRKIIDAFPLAKLLGVTATPQRLDGVGLGMHAGGYFDYMISGPTIRQLIDMGYLAQPVIYGPPSGVDLSGVKIVAGDYDAHELVKRIDKPKITGSAIDHYLRLSSGKPAITFCVTVAHAEHVAAEFNGHGIRSACIHGKLSNQQRDAMIKGLGDGTYQNLTSCNIVSEGTDIPVVNTAICLRHTASLSLCLQQWGRALRVYPGKTHAIILDHVGNCFRHGLPADDRKWSLDGVRKRKKGDPEAIPRIKRCMQCYAIIPMSATRCPQCGYETGAGVKDIKQVEGELVKIESARMENIAKRQQKIEVWKAESLQDFLDIADRRGYDRNWAHIRWNLRKQREKAA